MILIVFLLSFAVLFATRKIAIKIGLVDKANHRKHHEGNIPLVGGISAYIVICIATVLFPVFHTRDLATYLVCTSILVLMGALDDRFDISAKLRMLVQAVIAGFMMFFSDLYLHSFGAILGANEVTLGIMGYPITLLAVWASINAFNMIDGIDGLLGGLSCVTFAMIGYLLSHQSNQPLAGWCFVFMTVLLPYLLLNLGVLGKRYKVFMGDAGSTLVGFTVIWLLLQTTQGEDHAMKPVTALWLIAIPLMDMVAIIIRRLRKGTNPLAPDRQHIHHLMMRAGFSSRQSFMIITVIAFVLALVGVLGEKLAVSDWIMFVAFLTTFACYGYCIKHAWKVARLVKRIKRRLRRHMLFNR